ncbi:thioredoxin-disulfide reductase [Pseudochelatococcus contaminans]|uniref:Thioredoxin reductase n=1 Tax=Pseudochelatococcus contaminans TaxID=1538103 RepID=A0A7W5Z3K0_9HYPH|nr:thioredoxin-disulfide reductase [Pseudochelatococcus contaminans]MBB3809442.1 thioredoxin reductase (NADPH) [Pseudochelatococcus contaminans]
MSLSASSTPAPVTPVKGGETHTKLLIVGSGPAGYTAAIYAARALLEPVLVSGLQVGGQLTITTDVENYPGFADPIQGPWLVEQMRLQAEHVGARLASDIIVSADLSSRPFRLFGDSGHVYLGDALVIATGAQAKWLGLPSEQAFQGFGVSACATCDGFFFRNREVVVVGGGNTAVEEALYLAQIASKVTLVHRRDSLKAERILQERLLAHPKVEVIWNHVLEEIVGQDLPRSVTGVRLRDVASGAVSEISAEGVFIAIGHKPESALFAGQLDLTPTGYVSVTPGSTQTSVPGVFAAGDVADEVYRQAVTAAGLGCMAALDAERWLAAQEA